MSLIDPANPARWSTGESRSLNNGFVQGYTGEPIDWDTIQRHANLRTTAAKTVQRQREAGYEVGGLKLMGKKLQRSQGGT